MLMKLSPVVGKEGKEDETIEANANTNTISSRYIEVKVKKYILN